MDIAKKTTKILLSYRKNCATTSSPGQLIMPESLKLLPVLTSGLIKHACIKGGPGISTDERVYNMRLLKGASVGATVPIFYPRMFSIDDLPENVMALLLRILFCC